MKNTARQIVAALTAGIFAMLVGACQKSPEQIFAKVARSVVVVLALDSSGETQAQGSGVVVGENEVATNCHVIDEAESIVVRQAADSGSDETYRMDARVLTRDDERDLCLLSVGELSEPPVAPVAKMGAAKDLTVGEEVFAVGAPEGLGLSLSRGIVSQLRSIYGKRAAPLVQTDAAISPGLSGGGLFNQDGELVGVATFKWQGEILNFAIPVEWVEYMREQVQAELKADKNPLECAENPDYECVIAVAQSIARSIDSDHMRAYALTRIATARAEVGDIDGALFIVRNIGSTYIRAQAMPRIAWVQAESGNIDGAFATARSIDDAEDRAQALAYIALAQAEAGNLQSARDTSLAALSAAQNIDYADDRTSVLTDIASTQAKAGDVDGAFATVQNINDANFRTGALRGIASARAEAGDVDGAFATAQSIDDANSRAWILRDIALAQAKAGDINDAFATVQSIDNEDARANALSAIAVAQAEAEDIDSAFATAQNIDDIKDRAGALRGIALAQAEAENVDGAFATVQNIDDADTRAWALSDIASAQAKKEDTDGALSTVQSIDHARARAEALLNIAAKTGDFRNAMKAAMRVDDNYGRVQALVAVAKHLAPREQD